ncbi:hypothetical protein ACP4OV_005428 [Aristida adscensionis]
MAAAAGRSRHVQLYGLLLLAVLVIGDTDVVAARLSSPPVVTLVQAAAGQLKDLPAGSWEEEAKVGGGGWTTAARKEGAAAGGGGGGRRALVGSRAPTCTYNECRGCRRRCSAEEVPIDASDPINSAYRYKCVCHL